VVWWCQIFFTQNSGSVHAVACRCPWWQASKFSCVDLLLWWMLALVSAVFTVINHCLAESAMFLGCYLTNSVYWMYFCTSVCSLCFLFSLLMKTTLSDASWYEYFFLHCSDLKEILHKLIIRYSASLYMQAHTSWLEYIMNGTFLCRKSNECDNHIEVFARAAKTINFLLP